MNGVEWLLHWLLLFSPFFCLVGLFLFGCLAMIPGMWMGVLCYLCFIVLMEPSEMEQEFWRRLQSIRIPFADYTKQFPVEGTVFPGQCIYALHPHGLLNTTLFVHGCCNESPLFDAITKGSTVVHSALFKLPLVRECLLMKGAIPAHQSAMKIALAKGRSLMLIPGGTSEVFYSRKGASERWNGTHKGFLQLAMDQGIPIVPIYIENEQQLLTYVGDIPFLDWIGSWLTGVSTAFSPMLQGLLPHNLQTWWNVGMDQTAVTRTHMGAPFYPKGSLDDARKAYSIHVKGLFDSVHKGNRILEIVPLKI
uniref:Acyltransferase n=1 Tax=viral metagenome TaxID=1070528 RepID=A0A6C0K3J4_9ZZZZ